MATNWNILGLLQTNKRLGCIICTTRVSELLVPDNDFDCRQDFIIRHMWSDQQVFWVEIHTHRTARLKKKKRRLGNIMCYCLHIINACYNILYNPKKKTTTVFLLGLGPSVLSLIVPNLNHIHQSWGTLTGPYGCLVLLLHFVSIYVFCGTIWLYHDVIYI